MQLEATVLGWQGRLRIAGYLKQVENLIQFWLRSPRVILPENVGEVRMRGVEVGIDADVMEPVHLTLHGSYQETEDRSPVPYYRGNDLPGRPAWTGSFGVALVPATYVRAGAHLRIESDFYLDRANRRLEEGTTRLGGWVEVRGLWDLVLRVAGENLTDERGDDQWGYPLAGRRFRATLSYPAIGW
jgi:outer membrane receptor protein involved in Fe transport